MRQYLDLMQHVIQNGNSKPDRTGTGTKSVFGYQTILMTIAVCCTRQSLQIEGCVLPHNPYDLSGVFY